MTKEFFVKKNGKTQNNFYNFYIFDKTTRVRALHINWRLYFYLIFELKLPLINLMSSLFRQ